VDNVPTGSGEQKTGEQTRNTPTDDDGIF